MSNLLSYKNILDDIKRFKSSATKFGDDFNRLDTPSHKYFKILFYFGSVPEMYATESSSGLLAPTWEELKGTDRTDFYNFNSAWAFLKMNDELERAEKLEHFVTLLSDINTYSPWYFNSIGGIQEALERKVADDGKLDLTETKKLTITCLPDAFDNRLTTLLDLYRDITWSWVQKKEIIPANLRKFDMAIYIFEAPEKRWHKDTDIIGTENGFKVSYKMIEFHDCEISYNSIKSGWGEMSNETGFSPKYTIDISYNDCYEISYNDIMMRKIGDVILTDLLNNATDSYYESKPQIASEQQSNELMNRIYIYEPTEPKNKDGRIIYFGNLGTRKGKQTDEISEMYKYEYKPGFLATAAGQVAGHFVKDVKSLFTKAILGNIHTYSLTQIGTQISEASKGNLIKAGMTVSQYIKNAKQRNETKGKPNGDIFPDAISDIHKPVGNIFSKNTLANNL